MKTLSVIGIIVVAVIAVLVYRTARRNDRQAAELAAMTDERLLELCYWENQRGKYNNMYSREYARRQAALKTTTTATA